MERMEEAWTAEVVSVRARERRVSWNKAPPGRLLLILDNLGCRKTELSLWMINRLGPHLFTLWFRAGDLSAFQEDLLTSALYLKNELLRFNTSQIIRGKARETQRDPQLYFSDTDPTSLTFYLEVWMNSTFEDSRILVILDDLDGLENDQHPEVSRKFTAETLDLVYTTRDPSMSGPGLIWEAENFEVPPLEEDHAGRLLEILMRDYRVRSQRRTSGRTQTYAKTELTGEIVKRLGSLPAAIVIGFHFVKDTSILGVTAETLERELYNYGVANLLHYRPPTLKYTHSILESFEVSKSRLKRNVRAGETQETLYELSLMVLQLLSVLHLGSFSQKTLAMLCDMLGDDRRSDHRPLWQFLRSARYSEVCRCVKELIHVSLLSEADSDGIITLNELTISCCILVPRSISMYERTLLKSVAESIRSHANFGEFQQTTRVSAPTETSATSR